VFLDACHRAGVFICDPPSLACFARAFLFGGCVIRVSVSGSMDEIRAQLGATQKEAAKAGSRALNRTASRVRTYAARAIKAAGYNLKISDIKRSIRIVKASPSVLSASAVASGHSIPLIQYGARQTSTGVSVNVKSGRRVIPHSFIQTMKSSHRGVFIRREVHSVGAAKGLERRRTGHTTRHGLPIDELLGPSIPAAFSNAVVQHALIENVEQYFPVEMRRQLEHVLDTTR
jgi:hypothetical protein